MTETILHYRIVRELGRGGMGQVYLAEDTKLRRLVALKLLPPDVASDPRRVQRFLREAHAASIMSHPNIAVIHEIGEAGDSTPFIAMEYVEGRTLDDVIGNKPLELNQILDVALEIADALDEAHTRGVIHRDLKPANIIISTRGHVKVLDFGLAKVDEQLSGDAAPTDLKSDPGLVLGTVQYMSPEQALGRDVDARSDLFSYGVILYEMTTGRRPFAGGSTTELIERIVHEQPEAVARLNYNAPPELERIIRKCLEKDREWRYQSARDIFVDLKSLRRDSSSGERTAAPPARRRLPVPLLIAAIVVAAIAALALVMMNRSRNGEEAPQGTEAPLVSIAVLPFSRMSPVAETDHLQFALPDEVTTILSYNPAVAVRPFTTTRRLVDSDPIEAGKSLHVDKIVTGSYRSGDGRLAVTVEAIDVSTNRVVWRDNIDGSQGELIALRNVLSSRVRAGLLPALGVTALPKESAQPSNSEAYTLFLQALSLPSDPEPTEQALSLLQRAVALDASYAPAWQQMAMRHYYHAQYGQGGRAAIGAARAAARRALEIDPLYVGAARSLLIYDTEAGNIPDAYRRALELVRRSPRDADTHFVVSYALRYAGRLDDAARHCEVAISLDPFRGLRSCARVYEYQGNYDRARAFVRLDEGSEWAMNHESRLLLKEGKASEAMALLQKIESPAPEAAVVLACLRKQPVNRGAYEEIEALTGLDAERAFDLAETMAFCGETGRAFQSLQKALDGGYSIYPAMETNPQFAPLRRDARWTDLRAAAIRYRDELNAQLVKIEQGPAGARS